MNTFFTRLTNNHTTAGPPKVNSLTGRYVFICLLLCQLLYTSSTTAQQNLPNFTDITATQLTTTYWEWVRVDPAQPDNIDLLENRIFKMPEAGQGILEVEFKLVGGDGGTAHYNSGAYNTFANGGRGGEVSFTVNLKATKTHGKPFLVTFGKKGESTTFNWGMYCAAGGGGSSGMAWLKPGMNNKDLNLKWGLESGTLMAGAGGGGGGFATGLESVHGKNATRDASGSYATLNSVDLYTSVLSIDATLVAGGSGLDYENKKPESCCTNDIKRRQATSIVYNVFNYGIGLGGVNSGIKLTSVTQGQGGGKPTTLYDAQEGSAYTNNSMSIGGAKAIQFPVLKNGGRGGSGMAGGGAGSGTTGYFDIWIASFHAQKNLAATSGAGGTGTVAFASYPHKNMEPGDDGYNDYGFMVRNASIAQRSSTNNPQGGYLMYRTIVDGEGPKINNHEFSVSIGPGDHTLTLADVQGHITDNDSIKTITFSPAQLTCSDVGKTVQVLVDAYDFAGSQTSGVVWITVQANNKPLALLPEVSPYVSEPDFPRRIHITNGTYTLTETNFPLGIKGCTGRTGITLHFPPTTFNCASVGNQPVKYYYTDTEGNTSQVYTKTFVVTYSGAFAGRLYVDQSAKGADNGSSWADAFTSLQDALTCAGTEGREIYVAKGTYRPDQGGGVTLNDRHASFVLPDNYKLYGGFPSGGGDLNRRNPNANPTILTGEIGSAGTNDNSYHVVSVVGSGITLDGFTIRDGYADVDGDAGSGLNINQQGDLPADGYTSISNCKFINNYGDWGGAVNMYYGNNATQNYLDFKNCLFQDNSTRLNGGAVSQLNNSNVRRSFVNCLFNHNKGLSGADIYSLSETEVTNCTFGNTQGNVAIWNEGTFRFYNSILYYYSGQSIVSFPNKSFQVAYSNIQGSGGSAAWKILYVKDLGHNIDTDPLFHTSSELRLLPQSPSRNTGSNAYNKELYDIENNARVSQGVIDMGAYELGTVLYVDAEAPVGGNGDTWATAMNNLNAGIAEATVTRKDIWVKAGTYVPDRVAGSSTVTAGNRANTFNVGNLSIYGGFDGTETTIAARNIGQHPTVLNGDLGIQTVPGDNAYHVVTLGGNNARLDGLVIENGNAGGTGENAKGAGVYQVASSAADTSTVVANVAFRNNIAVDQGGAWYTAAGHAGKTDFVQCLFYANRAARGAGAFLKIDSGNTDSYDFNFYNTTALGNTALGTVTGAFEAEERTGVPARVNAYNSIWSSNAPQNYSDVTNPGHITLANTYTAAATGVFADINNMSGADGKIMTSDDGLRLDSSSPLIGYGDNVLAYSGVDKDVAGNPRIKNVIDAGAYESEYTAPFIPGAGGIMYVKLNATGNGTSWDNATGDLHNAIHAAGVSKVFVAKGNYLIGDNSFVMKNGVAIYGGFDPDRGITDLTHPRIMPDASNEQGSILNGQGARPVIWNVFTYATPMNNTAVLDGFTVCNGSYTSGGGISNVYASPTLRNLVIRGNAASLSGAGLFNNFSSPLVSNTVISGNTIHTSINNIYGAGVFNNNNSAPVLVNTTITDNKVTSISTGDTYGAGVFNSGGSTAVIYNSIIWNNQKNGSSSVQGADIENFNATLTLKNSITQGYTTGVADDKNSVGNPAFSGTDLRLQSGSAAINAGNNTFFADLDANTKDLAGFSRVYEYGSDGKIDIGAYEYQCRSVDYSGVTFGAMTVVYDGNPHSIEAEHIPQGVTATYEIKEEAGQTTAGNTATGSGIYSITATLRAAGVDCAPEIRTATLTIDKAIALITTSHTQDFVYDGTVKNVTASLNHTETALTYGPQQGYTEAGGYWVTVSAPETDNYLETSENVALVIANAEIIGIGLNDGTFTHDGQPKSLAITGTLPADAIVVYSDNKKTDVGTYTINALVQRPNYNDLWLTAEMTISSPLPVRWISFTARLSDDHYGVLDWKVDQASVLGYEIERSSNAKDFRSIGTVTAGNSEGIAEYNFTDPVVATGTVYYRIRQTDLDGSYGYSRIVSVKSTEGAPLTAYPNPVAQKVTVQLGAVYIGTTLKLTNTAGVLLQQLSTSQQTFEVNLDQYPAGVYLLYTWDGRAIKLIKN